MWFMPKIRDIYGASEVAPLLSMAHVAQLYFLICSFFFINFYLYWLGLGSLQFSWPSQFQKSLHTVLTQLALVLIHSGLHSERPLSKGADSACGNATLTLCNKANFDPLQQVKYDGLEKNVKQEKNVWIVLLFLIFKSVTDACMPYILKILLKNKSFLLFLANGRDCWGLISMISWSDKGETLSSRMTGLFVQLSPWWPLAMLLVWKRLYWQCAATLHYISPFSAWPPKVTTAPRDNCHFMFLHSDPGFQKGDPPPQTTSHLTPPPPPHYDTGGWGL